MSKIVLFRNARILEDKNMQVDDILNYLGTLSTPKTYNNAQLIKNVNDIDLTVKVDLDQDYMEKDVVNNYNYCSISNEGSNADTYFYFIRKINWKAKKCLELVLHLDVLNTFKGEYTLTDKTTIERMHKDRFISKLSRSYQTQGDLDDSIWDWSVTEAEAIGRATFNLPNNMINEEFNKDAIRFDIDQVPYSTNLWEFTRDINNNTITFTVYIQSSVIPQDPYSIFISYNSLKRVVDYQDEGITPVLYKQSEETIYDESYMKWYLMYNTDADVDPESSQAVSTYLIPEKTTLVKYRSAIYHSALDTTNYITDSSKSYYVFPDIPVDIYVSEDNVTWNKLTTITEEYSKGESQIRRRILIQLNKDGTKIKIRKVFATVAPRSSTQGVDKLGSYTYVRFGDYAELKYVKDSMSVADSSVNIMSKITEIQNKTKLTWSFGEGSNINSMITGIDIINRSNARIIKIIELPYCPCKVTKNADDSITLNDYQTTVWEVAISEDIGGQTINAFKLNNYSLNTQIKANIQCSNNPLTDLIYCSKTPANTDVRNDNLESKLLHSSYYNYKFVYDSFNYPIQFENYQTSYLSSTTTFNIEYVVANTCNTRFLFNFINMHNKYNTQDYENIMCCTRNNEVTLNNSNYLQYLRTGYNYDQKVKSQNQTQQWINVTAGIAKGAIGGAMSGGGVGAIAGAIIGAGVSIYNAAVSTVQQEQALQQKINELKNQAGTVAGTDDLDLLRYYTNDNKMKLCLYECSDNMKERLADLFYYCGYKVGVQAIPNTTSRYWFNFIQCSPVYDQDNTKAKINKECLDELTNKYKNGVTVYHHHTTWDFDQVKENWETTLIN